MATVSAPPLLTAEEYAQLHEIEGFRDELIEGECVVSPMAKLAHALVLDRLTEIITPQLAQISHPKSLANWYLKPAGISGLPVFPGFVGHVEALDFDAHVLAGEMELFERFVGFFEGVLIGSPVAGETGEGLVLFVGPLEPGWAGGRDVRLYTGVGFRER